MQEAKKGVKVEWKINGDENLELEKMTESSSTREFTDQIANLYRDLFKGIDTENYEDEKLIERIEFLENLKLSDLDENSLEKFSKSILDARAFAVITEGSPNDFELGDIEKIGGKKDIRLWFLKLQKSQVKDKLLEVLVHAWYKENQQYEIEDFEEQNYDVEKEVDFRLTDSKELIECKRVSGDEKNRIRANLDKMKNKIEACEKDFPNHTGHLIIDLGAHTSEMPTNFEEFSKQDFKDEKIKEIKSFLKDEIGNSQRDCIDKVTICWLGAYINKNTWYSLHKAIEKSFTDEEVSNYKGWTVRREKLAPRRSTIVVHSDNKSLKHAKAGYDASPKGGQTFFNWSGSEPTGGR